MLHVWLSLFIFHGLCKNAVNNILQRSKRSDACSMQGIGTVVARDVKAECEWQENMEHFYYTILWKSPLNTPVTGYHIYIRYGPLLHCFTAFDWERKFEFHESEGFMKGLSSLYAVYATIATVDRNITTVIHPPLNSTQFNSMKTAVKCPVKPKISPLPNEVIPIGSEFSFRCIFEEAPVPNASIIWRFSRDRISCELAFIIENNDSKYIRISRDKHTLRIIKAKREHIGCYIVIVDNYAGRMEQKGYLDLKSLSPKKKDTNNNISVLAESVSVILGAIFLVGFAAVASMRLYIKRRKKLALVTFNEEVSKKVYISHCTEGENDTTTLLKFINIIKSFNIDVIIDICSEASITSCGHLLHWIESNMMLADKIIILLSPSYLTALEPCGMYDNGDENISKVQSEFNFVSDMLCNNCHMAKQLIVISNDIKPKTFPSILQNMSYLKFPSHLNPNPDEDLDDDLRGIIGALLEKEPQQLPSINGYRHL